MADNPIPLKPKKTPPDDALDIDSLWLDPALGDGLVDVHYHDIPVGSDAAAVVLRGYELPTDVKMVAAGQRYFDERCEAMWTMANKLITKREEQTA